ARADYSRLRDERRPARRRARRAASPPLRERARLQDGQVDRGHRIRRRFRRPRRWPGRLQRRPRILRLPHAHLIGTGKQSMPAFGPKRTLKTFAKVANYARVRFRLTLADGRAAGVCHFPPSGVRLELSRRPNLIRLSAVATIASSAERGAHPRRCRAFSLVALRLTPSKGTIRALPRPSASFLRCNDEALALGHQIGHGPEMQVGHIAHINEAEIELGRGGLAIRQILDERAEGSPPRLRTARRSGPCPRAAARRPCRPRPRSAPCDRCGAGRDDRYDRFVAA